YNGVWTVASIIDNMHFTYYNPNGGLAVGTPVTGASVICSQGGARVYKSQVASAVDSAFPGGSKTLTALTPAGCQQFEPFLHSNCSCYAFGVNCPMGFSQASTRCTGFQYFEAGSGTQSAAAQFDAGDYAINAVSNNANVNSGSSIRVVFRNNDL